MRKRRGDGEEGGQETPHGYNLPTELLLWFLQIPGDELASIRCTHVAGSQRERAASSQQQVLDTRAQASLDITSGTYSVSLSIIRTVPPRL